MNLDSVNLVIVIMNLVSQFRVIFLQVITMNVPTVSVAHCSKELYIYIYIYNLCVCTHTMLIVIETTFSINILLTPFHALDSKSLFLKMYSVPSYPN